MTTTVMPNAKDEPLSIAAIADRHLFRERIGVAVPESSGFGDVVSLEQLADKGFVCLAGSRRFRELCDELCARRAFFPRVVFESDNPSVVENLIAIGQGVGF